MWPDFDSVAYALAGLFDEERGWGVLDDTFTWVDSLSEKGWFRVGDRDLQLCRQRTAWLRGGLGRGEVALRLRERLGIAARIVPATSVRYRTVVMTASGQRSFQAYVVRDHGIEPPLSVRFRPREPPALPEALSALAADLVVLGPSSPIASLLPILNVPDVATALERAGRVVAVSPVVGAVPPRTRPEWSRHRLREAFMTMLGLPHSPSGVTRIWRDLADGVVVDYRDATEVEEIEALGLAVRLADLLPRSARGRAALALDVVEFGLSLQPRAARPTTPRLVL